MLIHWWYLCCWITQEKPQEPELKKVVRSGAGLALSSGSGLKEASCDSGNHLGCEYFRAEAAIAFRFYRVQHSARDISRNPPSASKSPSPFVHCWHKFRERQPGKGICWRKGGAEFSPAVTRCAPIHRGGPSWPSLPPQCHSRGFVPWRGQCEATWPGWGRGSLILHAFEFIMEDKASSPGSKPMLCGRNLSIRSIWWTGEVYMW